MSWGKGWNEGVPPVWTTSNQSYAVAEEITLTIPRIGEWPKVIKAFKVGDLAYHEAGEDGFTVYHVPTSTEFNKAVPFEECTKEQALRWMEAVQKVHMLEWAVLRRLTYQSHYPDSYCKFFNFKEINEIDQAKEVIQKFCLLFALPC